MEGQLIDSAVDLDDEGKLEVEWYPIPEWLNEEWDKLSKEEK